MKSIITNLGSSVTADVFRMKMKKFVLIGSRSDNDTTLANILDNNTITDTNINNQSNISNYIITKPVDIDNSMITNDKTLVITLNLQPGFIDPTYYVYAIALVDETGDIYAISMFSENFNSISEAGEIITIRFKLTGTDIIGNEFISVSDESYITRREFIEWANNHNHDKQYATIRYLNNIIDELDQIKENKGTIGRLEDIKSLNNNNIVNVLNEIIENLGDINSLDVTTRDSIVSAINKIYSIIGDPKKLTKYDNIIESLEDIRYIAENPKGGVFADGVRVQDVEWAEKADLTYVGDINLYHGKEKGSLVDSINEIYDETIGNNNKIHKIAQISTNTNYKIFDKTQDYNGLMKITTFKNSIINSYFEVEVNTTPETIKIKNVSIKDELLNVGFLDNREDINNYIYGLSIVYSDKCLYLSIFDNEDKDGNILYDKIFIDYIKMNQQSTLSEEQFSTEGSIAIREGAGNNIDDSYKKINIRLDEINKKYTLLDTTKKFDANIELKNNDKILSTFRIKSDGYGDISIDRLKSRKLNNISEGILTNIANDNISISKNDFLFRVNDIYNNVGSGSKLIIKNEWGLDSDIVDNIILEQEPNSNLIITKDRSDETTIEYDVVLNNQIETEEILTIKYNNFEKEVIVSFKTLQPTTYEELKTMCDNLDIPLYIIDTSLITDMHELFLNSDRSSDEFRGITNWNVSNVTNFDRMFMNSNLDNSNILDTWNVDLSASKVDIFGDKEMGCWWVDYEEGKIMLPGYPGAGVGVCINQDHLDKLELEEMPGTRIPTSDNFGNYRHKSTDSIMVYIPKHYQRIVEVLDEPYLGNKIDISKDKKEGFFLPRAFINAGQEMDGIFIDKYINSNSLGTNASNGIMVSKSNSTALSSSSLSYIKGCKFNGNHAFLQAVKSRGSQFTIYASYTHNMISNLIESIWQKEYELAPVSTDNNIMGANVFREMSKRCAWADRYPLFPRIPFTSYNGKYADNADKDVLYTSTTLSGGTNDPSTFAKTTHNGQKCGITDFGFMEVYSGSICSHVLKKEEDLVELTPEDVSSLIDYNKFAYVGMSYSGWVKEGISFWDSKEIKRESSEYLLMTTNTPRSLAIVNVDQSTNGRYGRRHVGITNSVNCQYNDYRYGQYYGFTSQWYSSWTGTGCYARAICYAGYEPKQQIEYPSNSNGTIMLNLIDSQNHGMASNDLTSLGKREIVGKYGRSKTYINNTFIGTSSFGIVSDGFSYTRGTQTNIVVTPRNKTIRNLDDSRLPFSTSVSTQLPSYPSELDRYNIYWSIYVNREYYNEHYSTIWEYLINPIYELEEFTIYPPTIDYYEYHESPNNVRIEPVYMEVITNRYNIPYYRIDDKTISFKISDIRQIDGIVISFWTDKNTIYDVELNSSGNYTYGMRKRSSYTSPPSTPKPAYSGLERLGLDPKILLNHETEDLDSAEKSLLFSYLDTYLRNTRDTLIIQTKIKKGYVGGLLALNDKDGHGISIGTDNIIKINRYFKGNDSLDSLNKMPSSSFVREPLASDSVYGSFIPNIPKRISSLSISHEEITGTYPYSDIHWYQFPSTYFNDESINKNYIYIKGHDFGKDEGYTYLTNLEVSGKFPVYRYNNLYSRIDISSANNLLDLNGIVVKFYYSDGSKETYVTGPLEMSNTFIMKDLNIGVVENFTSNNDYDNVLVIISKLLNSIIFVIDNGQRYPKYFKYKINGVYDVSTISFIRTQLFRDKRSIQDGNKVIKEIRFYDSQERLSKENFLSDLASIVNTIRNGEIVN